MARVGVGGALEQEAGGSRAQAREGHRLVVVATSAAVGPIHRGGQAAVQQPCADGALGLAHVFEVVPHQA